MSEFRSVLTAEQLAQQNEQLLSDLGYALDELESQPRAVKYIAVVGSAGKTTLIRMAAAVLCKAGFAVGSFCSAETLAAGVQINGTPVDAHDCANLDAVIDRCFEPAERSEATRLACALTLFEQTGCDFALLELRNPALAQALPNLAAVLVAAVDEPEVQNVKRAAWAFRSAAPVIAVPGQEAIALQELDSAAETAGCTLIVPDEADFTPLRHRRLFNLMDYGGYRLLLQNLGAHMARNAAAVIELALALWRTTGLEIEDEAILDGLAEAYSPTGLRVLARQPLTLADCCHTPVQAAALARALEAEGLQTVTVIAGLSQQDDAESFFTALESGRLTAEITDKAQMAGMGEPAIDKVYLLNYGLGLANEAPGARLEEQARYHFDTLRFDSFEQALAAARQDDSDALLLCGTADFVAAAEQRLRFAEPELLFEQEDETFAPAMLSAAAAAAAVSSEEVEELLAAARQGEALFDDQFEEPEETPAQPFSYAEDTEDEEEEALYTDPEQI